MPVPAQDAPGNVKATADSCAYCAAPLFQLNTKATRYRLTPPKMPLRTTQAFKGAAATKDVQNGEKKTDGLQVIVSSLQVLGTLQCPNTSLGLATPKQQQNLNQCNMQLVISDLKGVRLYPICQWGSGCFPYANGGQVAPLMPVSKRPLTVL